MVEIEAVRAVHGSNHNQRSSMSVPLPERRHRGPAGPQELLPGPAVVALALVHLCTLAPRRGDAVVAGVAADSPSIRARERFAVMSQWMSQ